MKRLILISLTSLFASLAETNAASTISAANYAGNSSGPNGLPLVSSSGEALGAGRFFWLIGTFAGVPDWATATVPTLLEAFIPVDSTPNGRGTRPGLFNAVDYTGATGPLPAFFYGQIGYVLVGNNANLALSTALAVFSNGSVFPPLSGADNVTYRIGLTSDTSTVKFGKIIDMAPGAGQPNPASATPFVRGVALIPEASTALLGALGALGLFRRRR